MKLIVPLRTIAFPHLTRSTREHTKPSSSPFYNIFKPNNRTPNKCNARKRRRDFRYIFKTGVARAQCSQAPLANVARAALPALRRCCRKAATSHDGWIMLTWPVSPPRSARTASLSPAGELITYLLTVAGLRAPSRSVAFSFIFINLIIYPK